MLERDYQAKLIKKLNHNFKGCMILKNDSEYLPGIPDLTIFFKDKWAVLEVKKSEKAKTQPNQPEYIEKMDKMSYGSFIYPENEQAVMHDLKDHFLTG